MNKIVVGNEESIKQACEVKTLYVLDRIFFVNQWGISNIIIASSDIIPVEIRNSYCVGISLNRQLQEC